jgi:hypothetical protein
VNDTSDVTILAIREYVNTLSAGQKNIHGTGLYALLWEIRRLPEADPKDYPECEA